MNIGSVAAEAGGGGYGDECGEAEGFGHSKDPVNLPFSI